MAKHAFLRFRITQVAELPAFRKALREHRIRAVPTPRRYRLSQALCAAPGRKTLGHDVRDPTEGIVILQRRNTELRGRYCEVRFCGS